MDAATGVIAALWSTDARFWHEGDILTLVFLYPLSGVKRTWGISENHVFSSARLKFQAGSPHYTLAPLAKHT